MCHSLRDYKPQIHSSGMWVKPNATATAVDTAQLSTCTGTRPFTRVFYSIRHKALRRLTYKAQPWFTHTVYCLCLLICISLVLRKGTNLHSWRLCADFCQKIFLLLLSPTRENKYICEGSGEKNSFNSHSDMSYFLSCASKQPHVSKSTPLNQFNIILIKSSGSTVRFYTTIFYKLSGDWTDLDKKKSKILQLTNIYSIYQLWQ